MIFISHRGNMNGSNPEKENQPNYIAEAWGTGYEVEIDVWRIGKKWFLGHDNPQYEVDLKFVQNERLLCHAKNLEALDHMLMLGDIHCFWHQEDHYTITSKGYIVSYPGYAVTPRTICMRPEAQFYDHLSDCVYAICSDYVEMFK